MPDLIVDHAWRAPMASGSSLPRAVAPYAERPCEYMNCGRPRSEHSRAVSGKFRPAKAGAQ